MSEKEQEPAGSGELIPRVFDESFTAAARFKEPSAAERARRPGWLARRRTARQARRAGLAGRPPGRARRVVTFSLTLVLLAGVAGGTGWVLLWGLRHPAPHTAPRPAARAATSAAAVPAVQPAAQPADPFAGSPAESYADGAAGIVPPAPQPVGDYSRAQVSAAYTTVRHLLIAAHLNHSTLLGGTPRAFARLLTRTQRSDLLHNLRASGRHNTRSLVTSFAPGSTEFATDVVKVHGTMSATAATGTGGRQVLRVTADYLYVYAVQPPGMPAARMRVVLRSVDKVDFAWWDSQQGPLQPWWDSQWSVAGSCDLAGGFIHPDFTYLTPSKEKPSGKPVNPYDQSAPLPDRQQCRPTTGT